VQVRALRQAQPQLEEALVSARAGGAPEAIRAAESALRTNRTLCFNNLLDAVVALVLLLLTTAIVVVSLREWWLLWTRRRAAVLRETEPIWLPASALAESAPVRLAAAVPLALALLKELSTEAPLERAQAEAVACECHRLDSAAPAAAGQEPATDKTKERLYVELTERRFNGVTRCC
jgi:HEPN domain-containing protein